MLIRLEKLKDPNFVLVIDENDVYKGTIHLGTLHKHCLIGVDTVELYDYTFYFAEKEKINKYCKKLTQVI